jgi:hypothetical protein
MRTRLSICLKKRAYGTECEATAAARGANLQLRVYRCDRCRKYHLTSRTKGKRMPRPVADFHCLLEVVPWASVADAPPTS